jgi:hypothetical protein
LLLCFSCSNISWTWTVEAEEVRTRKIGSVLPGTCKKERKGKKGTEKEEGRKASKKGRMEG